MKDTLVHRSYHKIRKQKKFIPVVEDYLYKRTSRAETYRDIYKKRSS